MSTLKVSEIILESPRSIINVLAGSSKKAKLETRTGSAVNSSAWSKSKSSTQEKSKLPIITVLAKM